jgi:hypothetical protein
MQSTRTIIIIISLLKEISHFLRWCPKEDTRPIALKASLLDDDDVVGANSRRQGIRGNNVVALTNLEQGQNT